ncbi:MAG: aspartate/glutamate racemase family protein [Alphaproteobacteria bacterium]|jgi:arylmalonate decarboxylase|nr:aspartate/glutamate racemase family protein [Alphaproteobacteria bacterium]
MSQTPERVYGGRARMSLVVPSTNTVAETEFWRMAPDGVTVHTSRMPFFSERYDKPFDEMESHVPRVFDEANSAEPDVIAYGCTASSAKGDPHAYEVKLSEEAGKPTVTAAGALVAALAAFGAKRIALVTPYPPEINAKERVFFAENGIEVVEDESVIVDQKQLQVKNMNRVPTETLIERAVALGSRPDVDAVVLSCCDMPALEAIPRIEEALGKPVTSSTQALFWRAARTAGIDEPMAGLGRLLAGH